MEDFVRKLLLLKSDLEMSKQSLVTWKTLNSENKFCNSAESLSRSSSIKKLKKKLKLTLNQRLCSNKNFSEIYNSLENFTEEKFYLKILSIAFSNLFYVLITNLNLAILWSKEPSTLWTKQVKSMNRILKEPKNLKIRLINKPNLIKSAIGSKKLKTVKVTL